MPIKKDQLSKQTFCANALITTMFLPNFALSFSKNHKKVKIREHHIIKLTHL